VKLFINGKEVFEIPRSVFHFSYLTEKLKKGDNLIDLMAMTPSRYSDAITLKIHKKNPCVRRPESRLKLALSRFKKENTKDVKVPLSVGFERRLANFMREHLPVRFSRVEDMAFDKPLDPDTVRDLARKKGFHCIMIGNIEERKNSHGKNSIIITAHVEDPESGEIIVKTTDVYGEDADKDNIDEKLKTLAEHMKIKIIDELPMVEGMVLEKQKEWIAVDLGKEEKIKKGMEFIVYQQGETILGFEEMMDQDAKELGGAKVREVKLESSLARLNNESRKEEIQPKHRVITR
jgi:hypothetical protein